MPIHEKSLIRPENIRAQEKLIVDGVDVSGHWSTFIEPRVVTDYNERLEEEIAALPGGELIHRCWQCGSCTQRCFRSSGNAPRNAAMRSSVVNVSSRPVSSRSIPVRKTGKLAGAR